MVLAAVLPHLCKKVLDWLVQTPGKVTSGQREPSLGLGGDLQEVGSSADSLGFVVLTVSTGQVYGGHKSLSSGRLLRN